MEMQDVGKVLCESEILEFEKQFQIQMPQDFKAFMLKNNGGTPLEDWVFDYTENGNENSSVIRDFFIIYTDDSTSYDDLAKAYNSIRNEKSAPLDFMPIATDPGGNVIFLNVGKEDNGNVYFGNHELQDNKTGYIVMSLIANSFSEFINKCYLDE